MLNLFDPYEMKTQVGPALLLLLPPVLAFVAWFDSSVAIYSGALGVILATATAPFLAEFVAEKGRAIQSEMYATWGGRPTEVILTNQTWIDENERDRLRGNIAELYPDLAPTPSQDEDPWTGVDWALRLRNETRDDATIASAVRYYGLRRNTLGIRSFGIATSAIGLLVGIGALAFAVGCDLANLPMSIVAATLNGVALAFWSFMVSPKWVQKAARRYAYYLALASEAKLQEKR